MALYVNYSFIKKISREWRWGIVAIYTLAIYAFLPFGPRFWRFVSGQWGHSINFGLCIGRLFFTLFGFSKAGQKNFCLFCILFNIHFLSCYIEIYVFYRAGKISLAHVWYIGLYYFLGIKTGCKK